jgi:hypothetical protein
LRTWSYTRLTLTVLCCNWYIWCSFFKIFILHIFCSMFINNQQMHWFLAGYYFTPQVLHVSTRVSSSRSSSVPAELHANRKQWLIILCVKCCYVSVMWRPGMHWSVWFSFQWPLYILMYNDWRISSILTLFLVLCMEMDGCCWFPNLYLLFFYI